LRRAGVLRPAHSWAVPALFLAEFFLFLNTGPLNTAIVNSVSAPVRATAISINLFCIHFFGDTFSPQIIGAISDHSNPQHWPGRHAHLSGKQYPNRPFPSCLVRGCAVHAPFSSHGGEQVSKVAG
jgi:hypothetical protein